MDISEGLVAGKTVLLVWHGRNSTETIQELVEDLRVKNGASGTVSLEHCERLLLGKSKFPDSCESSLCKFDGEKFLAIVPSVGREGGRSHLGLEVKGWDRIAVKGNARINFVVLFVAHTKINEKEKR